MSAISILLLIITVATLVSLLIIDFIVGLFGFKHIFPNSGDPYSMAKTLYGIVSINKKILFAIFLVSLLFISIAEDIVPINIAFPVITGIVGYLFGVRDTSFEKLSEQKPK
jgi:hypothetical protein